jgi:hypothetical protein
MLAPEHSLEKPGLCRPRDDRNKTTPSSGAVILCILAPKEPFLWCGTERTIPVVRYWKNDPKTQKRPSAPEGPSI